MSASRHVTVACHEDSADRLALALVEQQDLLRGLADALRRLGPNGEAVARTVLDNAAVQVLRCSWLLWEAVAAAAEREDTDALAPCTGPRRDRRRG